MFFTVDYKKKIIFGWSPKCACSHIKNIFLFLQNGYIPNKIHTERDLNKLPNDIENYVTIIFSRNPYKRIISGFLDKYNPRGGEYINLWKYSTLSFSQFVDELIKDDWKMIEQIHFKPQTSQDFDRKIVKSKSFKCYDIENIDYNYIEQLYNKKITPEVLNKKQGHERKIYNVNVNKYVYDLQISEYIHCNVDIKYFFNEKIKKKIYKFYENDFIFFNEFGIDYTKLGF